MLSYCTRCNARSISRHGQEEQKADAKTNTNAGQKHKRTQTQNKRNAKDKHNKKCILKRERELGAAGQGGLGREARTSETQKTNTTIKVFSRETENWEWRVRADLGERPGLESYMHEAVGWRWGLQPT